MPGKFIIALQGSTPRTEAETYRVRLQMIATAQQNRAQYAHLQMVPFHNDASVNSQTEADSYLQLWELDYYDLRAAPGSNRGRSSQAEFDEQTDMGQRTNRHVATFPGVITRTGRTYQFRPIGDPTLEQAQLDPQIGKLQVAFTPVGAAQEQTYDIFLPEYEGVLEVSMCVRTTMDDSTWGGRNRHMAYAIRNVEASLRRQIAQRGGISAAFVADYSPASATDAGEAEFHKQAEDMIDTLPTFVVRNNTIRMGYELTNDYNQWAGQLQTLRNTVHTFLGIPANVEAPKIAFLGLYAHGSRVSIKIAYTGVRVRTDWSAAGSLRANRAAGFVQQIRDHLASEVVIALFACSAGGGREENRDDYGRIHPCEENGADSLGWTLYHELRRAGFPHATVWAHTNAAHTTRNPRLRVFCEHGSADFLNAAANSPRVTAAALNAYITQFNHGRNSRAAHFRPRLYNGNMVRFISVQNGLYLPWQWWNGSNDATAGSPGFNAEANRIADAVYAHLRGLVPANSSEAEDVVYENANRQHVTGQRQGVVNARLSSNFHYNEVSGLQSPFRLSVRLMKHIQILRHRLGRVGLLPLAIIENGDGMELSTQANNAANQRTALRKAQAMLNYGLFTAVGMANNRLHLSVSGINYDATWDFVTGKQANAGNPYITQNLQYSVFETHSSPVRLSRKLAAAYDVIQQSISASCPPTAILDNGRTLEVQCGHHHANFMFVAGQSVDSGMLTNAQAVGEDGARISY